MSSYNPRARRWPCCDCGKACTAMRENTRCPACRVRREESRSRDRCAELKSCRAPAAKLQPTPEIDPAIALYRAERAARDERRQRETDAVNAAIDETREILFAERGEKFARKVA